MQFVDFTVPLLADRRLYSSLLGDCESPGLDDKQQWNNGANRLYEYEDDVNKSHNIVRFTTYTT